jgi:hypothetical protein
VTLEAVKKWRSGEINQIGNTKPPDEPGRPKTFDFVSAKDAPKRGKGGNLVTCFII